MTLNHIAAILAALATLLPATARTEPVGLNRIEHIVVIYLENRSFDSLFGLFPGANGLADEAGRDGALATQPPMTIG